MKLIENGKVLFTYIALTILAMLVVVYGIIVLISFIQWNMEAINEIKSSGVLFRGIILTGTVVGTMAFLMRDNK